MQIDQGSANPVKNQTEVTYGSVIKELTSTATDLLQGELGLMRAELKSAAPNLSKHAGQIGIFGALFALSVFPLLAFAVIGLGALMGGLYWLSSLIVGVICASVGGYFGYQAFNKLKTEDLKFKHTRDGIAKAVHMIESKMSEVKNATHGGINEHHVH